MKMLISSAGHTVFTSPPATVVLHTFSIFHHCFLSQIYWFKDGKQISPKNDHYTIQRDLDGTCSLHTTASTLDDDGNYTIMAANPQVKIGGIDLASVLCIATTGIYLEKGTV